MLELGGKKSSSIRWVREASGGDLPPAGEFGLLGAGETCREAEGALGVCRVFSTAGAATLASLTEVDRKSVV